MKQLIFTFLGLLLSASIISQSLDDLEFGTDSTLDIVTWNIEWFPKEGATTIEYVQEIILAMEADVIAVQEIDDYDDFVDMMEEMDEWEGIATNSGSLNLGYIYNPEFVQMNSIYRILTDNDRELPRKPLVMEITFQNQDYVLINNHLKCCGDGNMNTNDPWDEETRRYDACVLIDEYIRENFDDQNVILLGDLNDLLTDTESNNVFQVFLDDPSGYHFVDMEIAEGPSSDWSYPSWPSHLDHIMISNELFDDFEDASSEALTIRIDDYLENGFWEYEGNVSDHRPVGLKLMPQASSSVFENQNQLAAINISPNPATNSIRLDFPVAEVSTGLEIRTIDGRIIQTLQVEKGQNSATIEVTKFKAGSYQIFMKSGNKIVASGKLFVTK